MGSRDEVLRRQSTHTKFKNSDMDFAFNWALGVSQIIGMSPGEVLAAVSATEDGDPRSWRDSFRSQGQYLSRRADDFRTRLGQEGCQCCVRSPWCVHIGIVGSVRNDSVSDTGVPHTQTLHSFPNVARAIPFPDERPDRAAKTVVRIGLKDVRPETHDLNETGLSHVQQAVAGVSGSFFPTSAGLGRLRDDEAPRRCFQEKPQGSQSEPFAPAKRPMGRCNQ